jgi:hypothetical protein
MEHKDEWVFFQEIDWDCPNNNVFWIDTRDFHCGYNFKEKPHKNFDKLKKHEYFFHTKQELVDLIERYFTESGGQQEWRFFNLKGVDNWNMKYIRIARTELGYIVCDSDWRALTKDFLSREVEKEEY